MLLLVQTMEAHNWEAYNWNSSLLEVQYDMENEFELMYYELRFFILRKNIYINYSHFLAKQSSIMILFLAISMNSKINCNFGNSMAC